MKCNHSILVSKKIWKREYVSIFQLYENRVSIASDQTIRVPRGSFPTILVLKVKRVAKPKKKIEIAGGGRITES